MSYENNETTQNYQAKELNYLFNPKTEPNPRIWYYSLKEVNWMEKYT